MSWLYDAVTMGDPRQHQFEFCLWTLGIIRSLLKKRHGIELSKSAVSRLLRHLGLSPQRPIYRCYKQDPKQIEKYLNKTFPELVKIAKKRGAEIYFVDEAAVRSDSHRGTTWGKLGQTPVVADGGGRFGLKLISAVSPRGDMRFGFIEDRMNSAKFIDFLKKLRKDAGRPVIVIADNASYHVSKSVTEFAIEPDNEVWVETLPAYAPELNPDEQVWNQAKRYLAKQFIETKEGMKRQMKNILLSIQKSPKLVRSFFELAGTRYAKLAILNAKISATIDILLTNPSDFKTEGLVFNLIAQLLQFLSQPAMKHRLKIWRISFDVEKLPGLESLLILIPTRIENICMHMQIWIGDPIDRA